MILLRRMIGDALRARRQSQHRTLREVSTAANVSLGYLSEIERGQKEASSELLASICDALGAQLSELLREVSHTIEVAERVAVPAGRPTLVPAAMVPAPAVPAGRPGEAPSSAVPALPVAPTGRPGPRTAPVPVAAQAESGEFAGDGAALPAAAAEPAYPATGIMLAKTENTARQPRLTVDSDVVVSVHQSGPFKATLRTTRNIRNAKRGREVAYVG
jgi:XRE family transcriptional regulator, stress-response regulator